MQLRAPRPSDAPAVLDVVAARDRADIGEPDYTLEDLHDEWGASEVDLAADTWSVEARERERADRSHRQWIAHANLRATALLLEAGYTHVRSYWRMSLELGGVQEPNATPGLVLRSLDIARDAVDVHAVDALSFAATPDYEPMPLPVFRERHLYPHDLDPELSRIAERDATVIGFLLARRWAPEGIGYVDVLGVHPDHQRRGVGSALLRAAFARFAAAGLDRAELGVASDNPDARILYECLGMRPRFQSDTYERGLTSGGQSPDR